MEENKKNRLFGLVGKSIDYSFSKNYFIDKFEKLEMYDCRYENFDIPDIDLFPDIISKNCNLRGLNVTIPYKEQIIPYLDILDTDATDIGAVNTILPSKEGIKGFNTDCYGFEYSLKSHLKSHHTKALILGTGGASKAVKFVLKKLGIGYTSASTSLKSNTRPYESLDEEIIEETTLIINCTPLGTFPNIDTKPDLPYQYISNRHLLYDLVYNPSETAFLHEGKHRGATIVNGYEMLVLQAERSWEIWNTLI